MSQKLSILVPIFNEERTLESIMKSIASACHDAQIIYVDDGSQDASLRIVQKHKRPHDLVLTKSNAGKGSAIRKGLEHATGTFTVIQDADLEYDPHELAHLVEEAERNPGSAIFGSRFLKPNPYIYWRFLIGNKVLTFWINLLFRGTITDSYTCYKLIPTAIFQALALEGNGFELEAEITAKCLKKGITIREVPISYKPRSVEAGKKIRFKDAWKGAVMALKLRYS
jgi:glycosyltransferase involved in cell wall biosynthesis